MESADGPNQLSLFPCVEQRNSNDQNCQPDTPIYEEEHDADGTRVEKDSILDPEFRERPPKIPSCFVFDPAPPR